MQYPSASERDISNVMNYITLTQTLVESYFALADEVQVLTDRNTILEHKLRYAHEQYQYLADKHAPAAPEISETLAKLQLPSELQHPSIENAKTVPLPRRSAAAAAAAAKLDLRNQTALTIRDGRRAARELAALIEPSGTSASSKGVFSHQGSVNGSETSMSTALEQDFTIEGKKGQLQCPFSATATQAVALAPAAASPSAAAEAPAAEDGSQDPTPHQSADPICAAMYEESMSQPAHTVNGSASKCPIRYLDQHSPEEIAHYVETHKHELPRSHTVCVGRYQKNEDQIRKLDAKYGNLVSMIQGLSALHQPMLPASQRQQQEQNEIDKVSNQRVENWAQAVTSSPSGANGADDDSVLDHPAEEGEQRVSHFDRPLKEVRVGESPSRPWGISVPVMESLSREAEDEPPLSPPPAPVVMPASSQDQDQQHTPAKPSKCPFDHTKMAAVMKGLGASSSPPQPESHPNMTPQPPKQPTMSSYRPATPTKDQAAPTQPPPPPSFQPTFINAPGDLAQQGGGRGQQQQQPHITFNGPVFIGYPMEQAMQFMERFGGNSQ